MVEVRSEDVTPVLLPVSIAVRDGWEQWKVARQHGLRRVLRWGKPTLTITMEGITLHGAGMDSEIRIPTDALLYVQINRAMPMDSVVRLANRGGDLFVMMV